MKMSVRLLTVAGLLVLTLCLCLVGCDSDPAPSPETSGLPKRFPLCLLSLRQREMPLRIPPKL